MKSKNQQQQEETKQEVELEEESPNFNEIDKLQQFGINAADLTKLKASGYTTVMSLIMATKKDLLNVKGISDTKIEKLQEAAAKLETIGFLTGNEVLQKRNKVLKITTGSKKLDELLGGGIESMALTEVFGEFRTGKTQLCHTLCVTAQLPKEMGGGNGKVAYIDSEGTFRPERIGKIAERYGLDAESVLDNIVVARAYTHEHQSTLLTLVAAKMFEETFSLLIIDSIMALFRVDFIGRGELSERQNHLGKTLSKLMKLAEQFNVAVFMTNQVMADPGATMTFMADPKKPVGGNILAHASTTRLYLRKGKGEQRICKIYDSPCLPESECLFQISDAGIIDAVE